MTISLIIADDHAVVRDGLCALLATETNINILGCAENGRKAVELVSKSCPDIVLMDIAMPVLNGVLATEQILDICPGTRVIILSMHSSKEHILNCLRAGASGFLVKESAGKEVIKAVKTVYSGARYLSPSISNLIFDHYLQLQTGLSNNPVDLLSPREKEVLQMVVEGKTSAQIAEILFLSPKTIDTYRSRLMGKLKIKTIPDLVKFAIRHGMITTE